MLYPVQNETRRLYDLSGIWRFRLDKDNIGTSEKWHKKPLEQCELMPVPSSYNDINQDPLYQNHIGDVWYETEFYIPEEWRNKDILIRFGCATHHAKVFINGQQAFDHKGGFLPFEVPVKHDICEDSPVRLTVCVSNVLDETCLPMGELETRNPLWSEKPYQIQTIHFDFFNYAGLNRPVKILALPTRRISDITITTDVQQEQGIVHYNADLIGDGQLQVRLLDREGTPIASETGKTGSISVDQHHLWQPGNAYLYTIELSFKDDSGQLLDIYRERIGIEKSDGKFLLW